MVAAVLFSQMWRVPKSWQLRTEHAVQKVARRPAQDSDANEVKAALWAAVAMRARLLATIGQQFQRNRSALCVRSVDPHLFTYWLAEQRSPVLAVGVILL